MAQMNEWLIRAGDVARDGWDAVIDASIPGWQYTGIRVGTLTARGQLRLASSDLERIIIPLAGAFRVEVEDGSVVELSGRQNVFAGPTDVYYLGAGGAATLAGVGRVAVAEAAAGIRKPNRYVPQAEVPVELRGTGRSSRQVHNFGTPEALDAATLIVCEVITPAENWSSYPAHKHDADDPGAESQLEEIYYFETAVSRGLTAPADADPFGMFSTYSSPAGKIDTSAMVRTGDIALVPYGYHGPAAAAPG